MNPLPLKDKIALVTGANTGIGRVTATHLALQGARVFLACRSEAKTQTVIEDIGKLSGGRARVEFLPLDLGNLNSIGKCAATFNALGLPLHILVNNAGLAGKKGVTDSGFELAFGVCHVGHFLLTSLLLPRLKDAVPSRVVVVASMAHRHAKGIDFEAVQKPTSGLGGLREYSVAKLANILFATELSRRLRGAGVHTYALHPGVVASDVWREVPWPIGALVKNFMLTPEQGSETSIYCATSPGCTGESGLYYEKCKAVQPSSAARDVELANRLWLESERWVGDFKTT
jgi:retinol dehydrogenase-12